MKPYKQISSYLREIEGFNKGFMFNNKEEEKKYLLHNSDRYLYILEQLDKILLTKKGHTNLLDIGTSPLTFILKRRYPKLKIYSVDYGDKLKSRCKREKIIFNQVDLSKKQSLLEKNKFDIVIFLEVIEHIDADHKLVMLNISKSLKKGGICLMSTVNKYSLKGLLMLALQLAKGKSTRNANITHEYDHVKEYSKSELSALIAANPNTSSGNLIYVTYFDTINSSAAYRSNLGFSQPFLKMHYFVVKLLPFLRRGMFLTFIKDS